MTQNAFLVDARPSLQRRGLRDRVYDLVLDMLLSSSVEPGTRLSIEAIARDLGVSPTPVREAMVQLERTGLITRVAHKGYRVAPPLHDDQLEALFDARIVLEVGATTLSAERAESVIPNLERALAAHIAVMERVNAEPTGEMLSVDLLREYFTVDWEFHRVIFVGTGNSFLLDMSEAISTRVHRMRQVLATGVSDASQAVVEHRAILDGFRLDPSAAAEAMRSHIEAVRSRSRVDSQRGDHR